MTHLYRPQNIEWNKIGKTPHAKLSLKDTIDASTHWVMCEHRFELGMPYILVYTCCPSLIINRIIFYSHNAPVWAINYKARAGCCSYPHPYLGILVSFMIQHHNHHSQGNMYIWKENKTEICLVGSHSNSITLGERRKEKIVISAEQRLLHLPTLLIRVGYENWNERRCLVWPYDLLLLGQGGGVEDGRNVMRHKLVGCVFSCE